MGAKVRDYERTSMMQYRNARLMVALSYAIALMAKNISSENWILHENDRAVLKSSQKQIRHSVSLQSSKELIPL